MYTGKTWLDRLKQRIFDFLIRLLGKVFFILGHLVD